MDDNRHEMAELWRYAHDPDLLEASVARWAYDRIVGLEAALAAVTGWPLRQDDEDARGPYTGAEGPLRGRCADPDDVAERLIPSLVSVGRLYLAALDEDPENECLALPAAMFVTDVRDAVDRLGQ